MPISSHAVASNLYLVKQTLHRDEPQTKVVVEVPTNHFAIIDCSGSMSYDLPKIREQLKKRLPKLLKAADTITLIWFSGRNQFGTLLEAEPVATLTDLKEVEQAIDRWLKPQGLTGFKEPLEEAARVVARVAKSRPGSTSALIFMSDGCDNQWSRAEILKAAESAAGGFSSATFVEYGYYADRSLLTAMAEKSGGALIFAEDFNRYAPTFENALQKKVSGTPKVEIKIQGDAIENFAYTLSNGDLLTYALEGGAVKVPADLAEVYYLSPTPVGDSQEALSNQATASVIAAGYAALSLFATRMKPKVVFPLLKALGDVRYITQFSTCFGKQAYSAFQEAALNSAFDPSLRYAEGWDPNKVPAEDAFTLLDLMQLLSSDDNNRVLLDHSLFKYSRIGRGRVDASDQLTEAEQEEIKELTSKLATLKKASDVSAVTARIAEITASKPDALKFVADPTPDGYSISSLTYNEDRPNISFLVRKSGTVDLSARLTDEYKGKIPENFETFIFRNYTVIKDGLVNIDMLPVRITRETLDVLVRALGEFHPAIETGGNLPNDQFEVILNLRSLPVINQKMVKDVSAKAFFETQYALTKSQAEQKVYNSFAKELLPTKKSEGFAEKYGDEATAWLKEQGFTDYSGFSPKSVQADATDVYKGKELKVSLKGLSKLPSLKEVRQQIAKGKLNAPGALMAPTITLVDGFLDSPAYKAAADQHGVLAAWLEGQTKAAKAKTRGLLYQVAQTTFALVVGQVWFSEFATLEENSMDITVDGNTIPCQAEMREIDIKI